MDFTLRVYRSFLNTLRNQGFSFLTLKGFLSNVSNSSIVLRHDVDTLPINSLQFARIQAKAGIRGSYYFRIVSGSLDEKIIKEIYSLGHEIGYHYEDLSFAEAKLKAQDSGLRAQGEELEKLIVSIGIESFKKNLKRLREIVPIKTICMHGSPMSRWDSRLLWKYYDYHDFGIVGEPYFDINFEEVLYLTDTGRRWDGDSFNMRDKAQGTGLRAQGKKKPATSNQQPATSNQQPATFPKFHSTFDIIRAAEEGRLPDKIMMTFHPQRWTDSSLPWLKELVWQNTKNVGKFILKKVRSGNEK